MSSADNSRDDIFACGANFSDRENTLAENHPRITCKVQLVIHICSPFCPAVRIAISCDHIENSLCQLQLNFYISQRQTCTKYLPNVHVALTIFLIRFVWLVNCKSIVVQPKVQYVIKFFTKLGKNTQSLILEPDMLGKTWLIYHKLQEVLQMIFVSCKSYSHFYSIISVLVKKRTARIFLNLTAKSSKLHAKFKSNRICSSTPAGSRVMVPCNVQQFSNCAILLLSFKLHDKKKSFCSRHKSEQVD